MAVEIKLDAALLARIEEQVKAAAMTAMETTKTDLETAQTMPRNTGRMQGTLKTDQFRDGEEIRTRLATNTPYARRLYFHPEYNFQKAKNPNAGALWYEPYESSGGKADFIRNAFAQALKGGMAK